MNETRELVALFVIKVNTAALVNTCISLFVKMNFRTFLSSRVQKLPSSECSSVSGLQYSTVQWNYNRKENFKKDEIW